MASKKEIIKNARRKRLNWVIIAILLLSVVILSSPTTRYYDLGDVEIGKASPRTFRADSDYRVVDVVKTRRRRQEEIRKIQPRFIKNQQRSQEIIESMKNDMETLREEATDIGIKEIPETQKQWEQVEQVTVQIARFVLSQGLIKDKKPFDLFSDQQTGLLLQMEAGESDADIEKKEIDLQKFKRDVVAISRLPEWVSNMLRDLYPDYSYRPLIKKLLLRNLAPTIVFEEDRFKTQIREVKEEIGPFYKEIDEGQIILSAGEIVSEESYHILRRMNQSELKFQISGGVSRLGLVLLGMLFLFVYFKEFRLDFFEKSNLLGVIVVVVLAVIAASRFIQFIQPHLPPGVEYGFPYAAAVILLAILVSPQVALMVSLFLSLLAISFFEFGFELFALYFFGGLAGLFFVKDIDRRSELMRCGAIVAAVQVYAVFLFYILRTGSVLEVDLGIKLAWAAFNGGILVPFVVIGVLPFLESGFDITTNFKLQELADLNHPLLQKLFVKAPGSYQHSIMLSNLCEQAAQAIGANTLLIRAGTYFHDIGKAEMPEYFVENQGKGNPHDDLKPTLSASILKSHVKKGSELAEENGLPDEIIAMIKQHHGTTKIQYFYHRALEQSEEEVNEEEFRYPGPIPQFKEAAILMIGDSVEAAARTIENPTHKKIQEVVQSIVYDKFKQGQLNQCELTLKDLDTLVETFTKVLASVHHKRIAYPDGEDEAPGEEEKQTADQDEKE